ncbi:hypothetical protein LPH52_07920 [Xylella taiwanensis]|uniref:Uncharacterized protein n=1 Tax=Xylella taiwanensis TaxID=1444770 RepID=Z9JGS4_9GAMM|nr:hypothetical protein [Xylella taiwanensis]EWS77228.1 hypothetical protein AF72_11955 [Xylella taiwanensis]MCD8456754.1 hypothetical protein [Xylella taiwanensis]
MSTVIVLVCSVFCGSGSFAISAAKIDPRMKQIATVSMYGMGPPTPTRCITG